MRYPRTVHVLHAILITVSRANRQAWLCEIKAHSSLAILSKHPCRRSPVTSADGRKLPSLLDNPELQHKGAPHSPPHDCQSTSNAGSTCQPKCSSSSTSPSSACPSGAASGTEPDTAAVAASSKQDTKPAVARSGEGFRLKSYLTDSTGRSQDSDITHSNAPASITVPQHSANPSSSSNHQAPSSTTHAHPESESLQLHQPPSDGCRQTRDPCSSVASRCDVTHQSVRSLEASSCHADDRAQGLSDCQTEDSAFPGRCFLSIRPALIAVYANSCLAQSSADVNKSPPHSFPAFSCSPAPPLHFQPKHPSIAASASLNLHTLSPASPPQAPHTSSATASPQTTQQLQQKLIDRSKRAKQLIASQGRAAVSLDGSWLDPSISSPELESLLINQHRSSSPTTVLPSPNPLSRSSSTASLAVSTQQPASPQFNRSVTMPGQARLSTKQHDNVTTTKAMTASPPRSGSSTPQRHNSTLSRMTQSSVTARSEITSLQRSLSAIQVPPLNTANAAFPGTPAVASPVKTPRGLPVLPVPSAAFRKKLLASIRRKSARRVLVERVGSCVSWGCSWLFALVELILKAAVVVTMMVSLLHGVSLLAERWAEGASSES